MNRRGFFSAIAGVFCLPFLSKDKIHYLSKEECKQMDAPFPIETYTTSNDASSHYVFITWDENGEKQEVRVMPATWSIT